MFLAEIPITYSKGPLFVTETGAFYILIVFFGGFSALRGGGNFRVGKRRGGNNRYRASRSDSLAEEKATPFDAADPRRRNVTARGNRGALYMRGCSAAKQKTRRALFTTTFFGVSFGFFLFVFFNFVYTSQKKRRADSLRILQGGVIHGALPFFCGNCLLIWRLATDLWIIAPCAGRVICLNSRKPQDQPTHYAYLRRLAPISARKARFFSQRG